MCLQMQFNTQEGQIYEMYCPYIETKKLEIKEIRSDSLLPKSGSHQGYSSDPDKM